MGLHDTAAISKPAMQLVIIFFYPPSSGTAPCVAMLRPVEFDVTCCVALRQVLIWVVSPACCNNIYIYIFFLCVCYLFSPYLLMNGCLGNIQ